MIPLYKAFFLHTILCLSVVVAKNILYRSSSYDLAVVLYKRRGAILWYIFIMRPIRALLCIIQMKNDAFVWFLSSSAVKLNLCKI